MISGLRSRIKLIEAFRGWGSGTYDGTPANLDGLQHVQHQLGTLAGEEKTVTSDRSTVDLVGEVDGLHGGDQVGDDTSHTDGESLLRDLRQTEGVLDNFLCSHYN